MSASLLRKVGGILGGITVGLFMVGCSRKGPPSEIVQARPLIYYHTVANSNENLADIAKHYDMSISEICRLNNLTPASLLLPGQKIFVIPPRDFGKGPMSTPSISVETSSPSFEDVAQESAQEESMPDLAEAVMEAPRVSSSDFIWPVKGRLLRRFNDKLPNGTVSEGINIGAPADIVVKAAADGTVFDAGELVLGFGKMVILTHDNGMISIYGHLQEISVKRPQPGEKVRVRQGQTLGRVGKTGNVRIPQLHFQLRNANKKPVNPLKYLPQEEKDGDYLP